MELAPLLAPHLTAPPTAAISRSFWRRKAIHRPPLVEPLSFLLRLVSGSPAVDAGLINKRKRQELCGAVLSQPSIAPRPPHRTRPTHELYSYPSPKSAIWQPRAGDTPPTVAQRHWTNKGLNRKLDIRRYQPLASP